MHKKKQGHEELTALLNDINKDKKDNYKQAIEGYIKFWKKRKIEWVNPPRKTWKIGNLKIELNPELGLVIRDKIYIIKLFTRANEIIDKRHADLILNIMESELREKVHGEEVAFAVLDVKRGKLFENKKKDETLHTLLKGEAKSFEIIWKDM